MKITNLAWPLLLVLSACSAPGSGAGAVAPAVSAPEATAAVQTEPPADVAVPGGPDKACNRIGATRMSVILDVPVSSVPNDGTEGVSECSYSPIAGKGPSVEYMVIADDNGATLRMVSEMKNYDPEPGKAFAGIGDRADVLAGGVLIDDGPETISLRLVGVDDEPATARKIFEAGRRKK
jgi:hypothetical protein